MKQSSKSVSQLQTVVLVLSESESESCSVVSNFLQPHGLYSPWNSPGQNTGVGSLFLFQGIFPSQRLNPGLLHCRPILYQLSQKGSPTDGLKKERRGGEFLKLTSIFLKNKLAKV